MVDDDPGIQGMLKLVLESAGYEVEVAANGRHALERLESFRPAVIVLDLEMPEMNGRAFYRRMREQGLDIPVLVLSAHGARVAQRELGAEAALDKPFDLDELLSQLAAVAC